MIKVDSYSNNSGKPESCFQDLKQGNQNLRKTHFKVSCEKFRNPILSEEKTKPRLEIPLLGITCTEKYKTLNPKKYNQQKFMEY